MTITLRIAITSIALFSFFNTNAQNGLNFDGANDQVQTTSPGVLSSADRTFEAWVYVSSSAPASNLAILDYGLNAVGSRNTFNVTGTRAISFISGGTNANLSSPSSSVPEDVWTHVAFTLNSGTGYLFVNGVQVATGSLTSVNTPSGNENIRIGQRITGGSIPFYGTIDEVRIWNVAKSEVEIQANMNNELCSIPSDLIAYYRFNQGIAAGANPSETVLIDDSGNGNNGTLINMALSGATSNWVTGATLTPGVTSSFAVDAACNTYTWAANATTYTSSGNYSVTLPGANSVGCDSILNLDLTINTSNDLTTNATACDSYTWGVNSTTYTSSTSVTETLTTGQGCSYLHTLNLTLGTSNSSSENVSACESYTWLANGMTYTADGTFTETLTNASGCDSVATLNLTITTIDNTAQDIGGVLSANEVGVAYQWLDCDNNNAVISGETNQSYAPLVNGSYAVQVVGVNCTDTSACLVVDYIGIEENIFGDFNFHPNPTNGQLTVDLGQLYGSVSVTVMTVSGQEVEVINASNTDKINIDLKGASGMYLLKVETDLGESAVLRVMKK